MNSATACSVAEYHLLPSRGAADEYVPNRSRQKRESYVGTPERGFPTVFSLFTIIVTPETVSPKEGAQTRTT